MSTVPAKVHQVAVTCSLADWSTNHQDFQMMIDLRNEVVSYGQLDEVQV